MLETLTILITAHLLADFWLQTDAMVRRKHETRWGLTSHIVVVAAMTWAMLGGISIVVLLLVTASHYGIDRLKLAADRWEWLPPWKAFATDQALHVAAAIAIAAAIPDAWGRGWGSVLTASQASKVMLIATALAGLIAAVWFGAHLVGAVMGPFAKQLPEDEQNGGLTHGGRLIGQFERLLVLVLVLIGQPTGVGFVVAAKSVLRIGELSKTRQQPSVTQSEPHQSKDIQRQLTEYVIIGTFASFAWALPIAALTRFAAEYWWAKL